MQVNLATSGLKNVPPAFSLPHEKDKLLAYAKNHPEKMFVQKSNNHRGIQIEKLDSLDLNSEGSFVQEAFKLETRYAPRVQGLRCQYIELKG